MDPTPGIMVALTTRQTHSAGAGCLPTPKGGIASCQERHILSLLPPYTPAPSDNIAVTTKILHVTMRPEAGIATAIRQYAEALPEARHAVAAPGPALSPLQGVGAGFDDVYQLPKQWREARSAIRQIILSGSFDVVHAHSSHAGALVRTLRSKARVVYSPHAFALLAPKYSSVWWAGHAEWLLGLREVTIAAVSDDEACRARRMSPRSRVVRLTNLPTVKDRGTARFRGPLHVVGCGRLTPQKHPEFFADVARLSSTAGLSFTFTWLGDGAPHYRKLLQRSGVAVTGWLRTDDLVATCARYGVLAHGAVRGLLVCSARRCGLRASRCWPPRCRG